MAVQLLLRDGVPDWWMSADIWIVPGNDPNGPPGSPIAGKPAYMWAHVANNGSTAAIGVRVDFFWADPSMQILAGTAHAIGSAFADIDAGDAQDVLCLVPWMPTIVNGGHECVIAVAHGAGDTNPIPDLLPSGFDFNPPAHDQIAQRNLSVLVAAMQMIARPLTIAGFDREDKLVMVRAEFGEGLDERALKLLGLPGLHPAEKGSLRVALRREHHCPDDAKRGDKDELQISVPRGTKAGVFVSIDARGMKEGAYALVRVTERTKRQVLGGLTYVVVKAGEGGAS